jgi:hypothetical protein
MKMKKIFILPIFSFILFLNTSAAQRNANPERMKERMDSYRIAFITEKLNLTPEESQKFWPLYNQFHEQGKKLRQDERNQKSVDDMSDAEAEQFIKIAIEREEKELNARKEFVQKLKNVLPAKKIAKLQGLEKEFKKELLERSKERRQKG